MSIKWVPGLVAALAGKQSVPGAELQVCLSVQTSHPIVSCSKRVSSFVHLLSVQVLPAMSGAIMVYDFDG